MQPIKLKLHRKDLGTALYKSTVFLAIAVAVWLLWELKGLLYCFSTCIEITGNNWYCFVKKNVENCKEKFQMVKKL